MTPIQKQIIVLRKRGVTNRLIAEKLGISMPYVNTVCMRFISEGLIEPREARKPRDPAVAKRNAKIVALFKQGMPSGKIATKLGINRDIVYSHIAATRTAGKLPRPKVGRGRPAKKTAAKKTAVKKTAKKKTTTKKRTKTKKKR